ncbi:MAG: SPOR domain-containing protein [Burkholderiaceae bacterium]|nr:SPOR domain-containing protein [Burkholderiaceae bacterium]
MTKKQQRGGTILGVIIGMVIGLAAALAVAVYVTKVPIPFLNKSQSRTAEQDAAETRKNRDWDPNAPLYGKNPARPAPSAAAAPASGAAAVAPAAPEPRPAASVAAVARPESKPAVSADPLGDLARARSGAAATPADPFIYFVQAGAFRTPEDADAQRAKLSLMGVEARVTEREQSGRTVYRVRIGPFEKKDDADRLKEKLDGSGLESVLVRVQR